MLLVKNNTHKRGLEKVPAPPEHVNTFLCLFHALSFTVMYGASQHVLLAKLSSHPRCRVSQQGLHPRVVGLSCNSVTCSVKEGRMRPEALKESVIADSFKFSFFTAVKKHRNGKETEKVNG